MPDGCQSGEIRLSSMELDMESRHPKTNDDIDIIETLKKWPAHSQMLKCQCAMIC